jgi:hypothetical protein
MKNFCTLFNAKYLPRGILLYKSLQKNVKNFHLYIFAFDELTLKYFKSKNYKNITVISLKEFEDKELLKIKKTRTPTEYFWTCTGSTLIYLFKKFNLKDCVYVDSDIYFFSYPSSFFEKFKKYSCVITKHNYAREYDQSQTNGIFCVQFLYFKNDIIGKKILQDWRKKCLKWCYNRIEKGKFGDQKYLDSWPKKFKKVFVTKHLGAGLAPWNLSKFEMQKTKNIFLITDKKTKKYHNLIFYHYHDFKYFSNHFFLGSYKIDTILYNQIYKKYSTLYLKEIKKLKNNINFNDYDFSDSTGEGKMYIINLIKKILHFRNLKIIK